MKAELIMESIKVERFYLKLWKNAHKYAILCLFQPISFQNGICVPLREGVGEKAHEFLILVKIQ